MALQALEYLQATASGLRRGTVVAFDREGRPLVRPLGEGSPIPCDTLDSGLGALEVRLGDSVCFAAYQGESTGCILGRVGGATTARSATIRLESLAIQVNQLVLSAKEKVTVGTQEARIVLDAKGHLESVATTIVSRARRLQKLLAPMVRLN